MKTSLGIEETGRENSGNEPNQNVKLTALYLFITFENLKQFLKKNKIKINNSRTWVRNKINSFPSYFAW